MSYRMNLHRLMRMSLTELACRTRQETAKWLDRVGMIRPAPADLTRMLRPDPGLAELHTSLLNALPTRFFEGAGSNRSSGQLADSVEPTRTAILASADTLCEGRFDLLGYQRLWFGDPGGSQAPVTQRASASERGRLHPALPVEGATQAPVIDWHWDPISCRRAPLLHWSRLDPLDPNQVGDSKVVWELNRHQWLVRLGQAYWFTGDERYADCFMGSLESWLKANPPGMGINWASGLEVALRLIAWSWALVLFRSSRALSAPVFLQLMVAIWVHAHHIERYLSYYFAPNTHLTGEALGLFYAGILFPEFQAAARWRTLGARILIEQCPRHILPDGVYFEQATCYHRYTAEIYLHFLILAQRHRIALPPEIGQSVQRLLDALLTLSGPDGTLPQIGDADGGWLLPLVSRTPEDCRGIFSTGAALFARAEYAWAAGGPAPETWWLLGVQALHTWEALRPEPPRRPASCLLPAGGYAIMRSYWGTEAHQLILDAGPLGSPIVSGHAHADLLSIQCWSFGEPFLIDPGTYCYTLDPVWRDYFRSTAAHNTITIDETGQAAPAGPFAWRHRPSARLRRWVSTARYDLADAEHDGYRGLTDPVHPRRRVIFVKPRYWIVIDDLHGAAEHHIDLWFHFAPSVEVDIGNDRCVSAWSKSGRGLFLEPFSKTSLDRTLYRGSQDPIAGWVSLNYGRRDPAPTLRVSTVVRLPVRIVTLLMPLESRSARQPQGIPLVYGSDEIIGLSLDGDREQIRFEGDSVTVT